MKKFDYYIFIDYSEGLIGYMIIENNTCCIDEIINYFGNSILYGHNWNSLLGDLENAKPGYTVEIIYKNSVKRYFRISYIAIVNPNQIHVLNQTNDARLTIYTCTGFLDQKRLVVTAEYQPPINTKLSTSL